MVSPEKTEEVTKILSELNLVYDTMVSDVKKLIEQEEPAANETLEGNQSGQMSWTRYHRYDGKKTHFLPKKNILNFEYFPNSHKKLRKKSRTPGFFSNI